MICIAKASVTLSYSVKIVDFISECANKVSENINALRESSCKMNRPSL